MTDRPQPIFKLDHLDRCATRQLVLEAKGVIFAFRAKVRSYLNVVSALAVGHVTSYELAVLTCDDHPKLEYDYLRREFTRQVGIRDYALPEGEGRSHISMLAESAGVGVTPPKSRRYNWVERNWMLYEYWVVTDGSGCVLTTNSVIIPKDAAAPFRAYRAHEGVRHETEGREIRTKNTSGLSTSLARVMVLFARTTSTSRIWSSAEPQRRDGGPRPPIVACPVQGVSRLVRRQERGLLLKERHLRFRPGRINSA